MGLMNAIGLQPRNPTTSVTSQGTQTLALQLQNAETQTEREMQEPGTAASGPGAGKRQLAWVDIAHGVPLQVRSPSPPTSGWRPLPPHSIQPG